MKNLTNEQLIQELTKLKQKLDAIETFVLREVNSAYDDLWLEDDQLTVNISRESYEAMSKIVYGY